MRRALWLGLAVAVFAGAAGCDGEGGTTGPAEKSLAFTLVVPGSIPTKQVIEIEVWLTRARLLDYPLTVTFEEANTGQPFTLISTVVLREPGDRVVRISEDAARDPLYRVTICEADQSVRLCVSRTAPVDVLDFP